MSDYTPVHMYSGVMACIAQILREGAISAEKLKSLRERAYIRVRAYQKFESETAISAV
jgi:hypothetical protein